MKRFDVTLRTAALAATLSLFAGSALADGLAARDTQLPQAARTSLVREIAAYRAAHPEAFRAVASVRGIRQEVYGKFRNPKPVALPELRALGASALLPMLEALAFEAPKLSLSAGERTAYVEGMLEAVGLLRDARSGPVLLAVFESGTTDPRVLRAAAEAMGRLCGDAELASLTGHTGASDPLRDAAIAGLGECRRIESANHLASLLASAKDDAAAIPIARALGVVGSSWAWRSMGPAAASRGLAVREAATRALVSQLPTRGAEARHAIASAVRMTEHPLTGDMLRKAAVSAKGDAKIEIDRLIVTVQKRP